MNKKKETKDTKIRRLQRNLKIVSALKDNLVQANNSLLKEIEYKESTIRMLKQYNNAPIIALERGMAANTQALTTMLEIVKRR